MNITVIGATGMVGSRLVTEAAGRGHVVTAASRNPGTIPQPARVVSAAVDVADSATVLPVMAEADAAILTIRPERGNENVLASLTATVLDAASVTNTPVLVIGGAGPLQSPNGSGLLAADDPAYVPPAWRSIATASIAQLRTCQERGDVVWTYLSPPAILEPGTRTGRYRRGTTALLTDSGGHSRISAEDFAVVAVDEIEKPGAERHFTVASA